MPPIPSKRPLFLFEALGSLACGFYGNYVFFLFRDRFGFADLGNLAIAALMGCVVALASWQSGRLAERHGCVRIMRAGLLGMIGALLVGAFVPALAVQLLVLVVWTAAQFMVWPALEAMISGDAGGAVRARLVGIYSVVWASCSALAYFFGGGLFEILGANSIFWLPPMLHLVQILLLGSHVRRQPAVCHGAVKPPRPGENARKMEETNGSPRMFQKMAWLANPFACVAAFTLLAMMPELARRMGLSTTMAGLFCSIWFFARLAVFVVMWQWPGWHYRFRWLLIPYLLLIAGFATVLTADGLWMLGAGQIAFGMAVGGLYYASLFYSMDVGEARAEQGGVHEAMMGAGNCIGPGLAAVSIMLAPGAPHAGVATVSAILLLGLAGLLVMRKQGMHAR